MASHRAQLLLLLLPTALACGQQNVEPDIEPLKVGPHLVLLSTVDGKGGMNRTSTPTYHWIYLTQIVDSFYDHYDR